MHAGEDARQNGYVFLELLLQRSNDSRDDEGHEQKKADREDHAKRGGAALECASYSAVLLGLYPPNRIEGRLELTKDARSAEEHRKQAHHRCRDSRGGAARLGEHVLDRVRGLRSNGVLDLRDDLPLRGGASKGE